MIVNIQPDVRNMHQKTYTPSDKYRTTRVELTDDIPNDHDIVSIRLETIPHNLRKVYILLGHNRVGTILHFLPGQNLLEQLMYDPQEMLPVSKCRYMKKHIEFCYENDLSDSTDLSTYYCQEEIVSKRVLSEDIEEFYDIDEDEFRKGKQVLGYDTEIIQHLWFKSPGIVIETKKNECDPSENEKFHEVKIWHIHTCNKDTCAESDILRYINDYELCLVNGEDVIEKFRSLEKGEKMECKLTNRITFSQCLAGLARYHF